MCERSYDVSTDRGLLAAVAMGCQENYCTDDQCLKLLQLSYVEAETRVRACARAVFGGPCCTRAAPCVDIALADLIYMHTYNMTGTPNMNLNATMHAWPSIAIDIYVDE